MREPAAALIANSTKGNNSGLRLGYEFAAYRRGIPKKSAQRGLDLRGGHDGGEFDSTRGGRAVERAIGGELVGNR